MAGDRTANEARCVAVAEDSYSALLPTFRNLVFDHAGRPGGQENSQEATCAASQV